MFSVKSSAQFSLKSLKKKVEDKISEKISKKVEGKVDSLGNSLLSKKTKDSTTVKPAYDSVSKTYICPVGFMFVDSLGGKCVPIPKKKD
jgi:hypothetical protein